MKFKNTEVWGFEHAIRGMRNPKNSWDKSDSLFGFGNEYTEADFEVAGYYADKTGYDFDKDYDNWIEIQEKYNDKLLKEGITRYSNDSFEYVFIGPNDMKLAQTLIKSGPEHRKFLRQIFVSVDITAPLYWWKEMDTYKVSTVANSTSTMHKLASTPITLDCFETDDMQSDLIYYSVHSNPFSEFDAENSIGMLADFMIEQLEFLRQKYLETKDKRYWKELVRWLPESWLQTRTWTANYETIRAICQQRRNHKLNEWSGLDDLTKDNFIQWARNLPYAQYFIFDDENIPFEIEK